MWNKLSCTLAFLLIAVNLNAATTTRPATSAKKDPPIREAFSIPAGAQAGWAVRDANTDSMLEEFEAHRNLTPASIQKLYTTWIALDLLGPEKTFTTTLAYTGLIDKGVLKGDLIIQGGGDPSFGDPQFDESQSPAVIFNGWIKKLNQLGIHKITGCIVGDGSYLVEEGPHPDLIWEDAGNYYAGIVSGLSFNGNIYATKFIGADKPGLPVSIQGTYPKHSGIEKFENHVLTGPNWSSDSAYIFGAIPSSIREVRGTYPAGQSPFIVKGSLPNPAWTSARELHDFLTSNGIEIESSGIACGDSTKLPNHTAVQNVTVLPNTAHQSPPLKDLIRYTNQKSDNNFAAQLFALIGKTSGATADWRGGLQAEKEYLVNRGFNPAEYHFKDGNGLSRYNWVSPAQTSHLLAYASTQKYFSDFQNSLLSNYGEPTTTIIGATPKQSSSKSHNPLTYIKNLSWTGKKLEKYGTGWEGKLWVKTGTLEGVSSLAGYLKTDSGRLLAFSISVNNFEGKGSEMQKSFGLLLKEWNHKF